MCILRHARYYPASERPGTVCAAQHLLRLRAIEYARPSDSQFPGRRRPGRRLDPRTASPSLLGGDQRRRDWHAVRLPLQLDRGLSPDAGKRRRRSPTHRHCRLRGAIQASNAVQRSAHVSSARGGCARGPRDHRSHGGSGGCGLRHMPRGVRRGQARPPGVPQVGVNSGGRETGHRGRETGRRSRETGGAEVRRERFNLD